MDKLKSVDMMALAREAQDVDAQRFRKPGGLRLIAPAKVNLLLAIGEQLPDGYHSAVSIMHTLLLHDVVWMKTTSQNPFYGPIEGLNESQCLEKEYKASERDTVAVNVTMRFCDGIDPVCITSDENIAARAVRLLAAELNEPHLPALDIHIEKHIPAQAGLGGGSADAAAALVGAARLWGIDPEHPAIKRVARRLGADVPFFLYGGCACLTGRGDDFQHNLQPMKKPVVIVRPSVGVSTSAAYRAFDEHPVFVEGYVLEEALRCEDAACVPLVNNLTDASERIVPTLREVGEWLADQPGLSGTLMSGSGSAFFGVAESFADASAVAARARCQGWWARATSFSPAPVALTPRR